MKLSNYIFTILFFTSCSQSHIYVNKRKSFKVILNKDSTYCFKFPDLFEKGKEYGSYTIKNDIILLKHKEKNNYDTISFGAGFRDENQDSLTLSFTNIYKETIPVSFTINNKEKIFKTNSLGYITLSYQDLHLDSIISNYSISTIKINYLDKKYVITNPDYRAADYLIELNQFLGQDSIIEQHKYEYYKDSIIINDFDPKWYGNHIKLTKK